MTDNALQEGIKAYRAGEKDRARALFASAIKQNQNDVKAWGWMYNVCANDKERIHCLQQILRLDPKNEKASQLLKELSTVDFPLERPAAVPMTANPPQQRYSNTPIIEKKNNNTILWLIVAVVSACVVLCCMIWFSSYGTNSTSDYGIAPTDAKVQYVITGSARSATVTYYNAQGGTEQIDVNIPFKKDMTVPFGAYLSLLAQNNGSGTITCEIWINGEKTKTSTSTAEYGIVTCADFAQ